MAIIQAYQCDKTKRLFSAKDKYLEHLRTLARTELRTNKAHPRMAILKRRFEVLRKTARSFNDVERWLENNVRILEHLSIRFQKKSAKAPADPTFIEKVCFYQVDHVPYCATVRGYPIHGIPEAPEKSGKEKAYPGARGDFCFTATNNVHVHKVLKEMAACHFGGGYNNGNYYSYAFTMFGEDWPFVGARCLFDNRHSSKIREGDVRILQYAFPGMTLRTYEQLHSAGLLPDSLDEFNAFIFKYTEGNHSPPELAHGASMLPTDLSCV